MMDTQQFLEELLQSGKSLAEQGKTLASEGAAKAREGFELAKERIQLHIPEEGPERDELIRHLGTGAAAGGLLALLVGTKTGRKVLSPAIKLGSLAALSAVGYKVYQDWQQKQGIATDGGAGHFIEQLAPEAADARAMTIVRAMIAAARADGVIDVAEREAITKRLTESNLQDQAAMILIDEMQKPVDFQAIAAAADSPEAAVEIYLASMAVVDTQNEPERLFLDDLAAALDIDAELKSDIEAAGFSVG